MLIRKVDMKRNNNYIYLSIFITVLILASGAIGISSPEIYEKEAFNWQVQAVWQDYIDVFLIVPVLVISGVYAYYKKSLGEAVWSGSLIYVAYSYTIYAFDIHFNELFYFYCLILGLSFYSLIWHYYEKLIHIRYYSQTALSRSSITGTYFIILGTIFYLIWLADLTPSMLLGKTPIQMEEFQIPTNPVYVIDLSIILPAYIITGVMIYINARPWKIFTPPLLVFATLMSLTIGGLQVLFYIKNYNGSLAISIIMFILAIIDILLLASAFSVKKTFLAPKDGPSKKTSKYA